jgi:HNH endonuclease
MATKACSRCGADKPMDEFNPRTGSRDGRASWCKACAASYSARWRQENADHLRAQKTAWRHRNRDRINARRRQLRAARRVVKDRPTEAERFWAKVDKTESCWLWTGALAKGYGQFGGTRKQRIQAHRWAYQELVGSIPEGLELDHLCRVRRCVNPAHLEPVTHSVNIMRSVPYRRKAG